MYCTVYRVPLYTMYCTVYRVPLYTMYCTVYRMPLYTITVILAKHSIELADDVSLAIRNILEQFYIFYYNSNCI